MYHYLVWRQDRMTHERPAPDWMPLQPFWRRIASDGRKVVAIDIPLAYSPEPFPGVEISGWATHEILEPPASHPPELMARVFRQFGKPPFDNEEAHLIPATLDARATHNVQNAMFAAAMAFSMGMKLESIRHGLQTFDTTFFQAPGRGNVFDEHPFKVILDYGHNAAAMKAMVQFVERLGTARGLS